MMKFLFSFLVLILFTESCNSTKEAVSEQKEPIVASKSSKEMTKDKSDIIGDHYATSGVTYTAMSRGFYEYVQISGPKVSVSTDRNLQDIDTYTYNESDWKQLKALMDAVDLQTLNKLKAPTHKRLHDGAAHATLAFRQGDMEVMTPTFDHGHPPKEIEALVNKVLSIKENVLKQ